MYAGGAVLAWRAHQLDDLRMRARARTKRAFVLDGPDPTPVCKPCRRSLGLSDLAQPAPAPTWSPETLAGMASRVHGTVPRAEQEPPPDWEPPPEWETREPPRVRLDVGATDALWRSAVYADDTELLVPLWRPNRDLTLLGGVSAAYVGFAFAMIGGLGGFATLVASLDRASPDGLMSASAMTLPLDPAALPLLVACGAFALWGSAMFASGMLATWRSNRRDDLHITLHGIRYVGRKISFDEILGVSAQDGSLVFDLLDGSQLLTPEGSLEPLVAESLGNELRSRLPSPDERAAAFVAYERARQALRLG